MYRCVDVGSTFSTSNEDLARLPKLDPVALCLAIRQLAKSAPQQNNPPFSHVHTQIYAHAHAPLQPPPNGRMVLPLSRCAITATLAALVTVSVVGADIPLPFPLPAKFSFGLCGSDPTIMPGCLVDMTLAAQVTVSCSTAAGCDPGCHTSALAQGALSRYAAALSGETAQARPAGRVKDGGPSSEAHPVVARREARIDGGASSPSSGPAYWWRLNNTNCNLHDMPNLACQANGTLDACKKTCAANADCGGFLYYSKTGEFALKNRTCWDDIGPLPESDYGDDLFVMHPSPQPDPKGKSGALVAVTVCIASASERLGISTDESYVLDVPSDAQATATVSAPTVFGAMHALESLTQIVDVRAQGVQTIPSAPVHIEDAPQYPFRGLMIDSGRHFLPVAHVKHVIAAAAMVKLNVIHWHLTDAQSFATCSHLFPALCAQGAYPNNFSAGAGHSPSRNVSRATYSLDELRDIVSFAKGRGVRIQPEWDMPGHGAWGMGMPQLVTSECAEALDVTRPELCVFVCPCGCFSWLRPWPRLCLALASFWPRPGLTMCSLAANRSRCFCG